MTQIRRHILVVGSVGADIVVEVNRMPARGETLSASKPDTGNVYPGGKGDNQAATIAKLIGPDHPTLIAKMACQFGNDTEKGSRATCLSGLAFVFVYPDGDNSIVIVSGANSAWPEELPTALIDAIKNAAIVLVQCEIPVRRNVLPLLTFVCPNETELARLTTRGVNNVEDAIEASRFLQDQGAKDVLVTLGSDGSVFVPADGSKVLRQSAFKVDNVVDTTGAGDCYRGAFVVAFAEGRALQDCMLRASAASALCVQHAGALPSLPSTDEVVAFLKVNGFE
ncbi:hypothetical protein PInf_012208 [Phytophthora infestans]|nr:hypothetical protein PInf_012208 [Phytophthora infestans]